MMSTGPEHAVLTDRAVLDGGGPDGTNQSEKRGVSIRAYPGRVAVPVVSQNSPRSTDSLGGSSTGLVAFSSA